jgi:polysaccharide export outer membrane protein
MFELAERATGKPDGLREYLWLGLLAIAVGIVAGCSSATVAQDVVSAQSVSQQRNTHSDLNKELAAVASRTSLSIQTLWDEYPIGAGDLLEISVFDVPELNTKVRVSRQGAIVLPLVGELIVGDLPPREVERLLTEKLTVYMHDPEVSVFVAEYRSQQVSVTGAVNNPAMHTLMQPRTVLEVVSMSGGLSPQAGKQIYVNTVVDEESKRFIIDLKEVLSDPRNEQLQILLRGGDSIFVPEAGVVFVEGAVNSPGAYPLKGATGIIEAIAMAKGTKFEARESEVQVFTSSGDGERVVASVPLDKIRANEVPNYELQDGDIVVVPSNAFKKSFAGFWRGFQGVFGMGYSINGP